MDTDDRVRDAGRPSRPYWHVDAKWVTGLLLFLLLGPTLAIYSLAKVTEEQPAVDAISAALAVAFSRNGLDDETEIASMLAQVRASPDQVVRPFPGLRIEVREQDLVGLSPRQARLRIFRQLAEPVYLSGPQGLTALADSPETRKTLADGVGPLGLVSAQTHESLLQLLTPLGIACLVLLVPFVFFSYRFGRLFSPGFVLFAASLPGAAVFAFIGTALQNPPTAQGSPTSTLEMAGAIAGGVLPPLAQIAARSYSTSLLVGFALLALAFVLWAVRRPAGYSASTGRVVSA